MVQLLGRKKSNDEPTATEPPSPQLVRSRFQEILDHVKAACKHVDHAAHLSSKLTHDFEKGLQYLERIAVDLTQAIGEAGGQVQETNIEQEIAAYIPKQYRNNEPDAAQ